MGSFISVLEMLLLATFRMSIPLTLVALGGIFSARAGIVALGLEGIMLGGAFGAAYGTYLTSNPYLGLLSGILVGIFFAMIHGVLCIKYKIDQVISSIGLNLLSQGLTTLLLQIIWGNRGKSVMLPRIKSIALPIFGDISPLFIITIVFVILSWVVIYNTKYGLHLRMVGEHPEAALSVGIKVGRVKYIAMLVTGFLGGLGGAYLSIDHLNMFVRNMTAGRGFIALAIDILGRYNPIGVFFGSILFGFTDALQMILQNDKIPGQIVQTIPYIVTLFVIVFAVKYVKAPAAMGKNIEE
ncbi:ABC transporter permease [Proteiniborus sp. MB09-C3]|uniref:ABC transporter permease n=1 Tax=Proteiniborus sp. MB09-C3 TaxID=3050072 RepID=UPI0025541F0B|nr:ABC transporter permease [Proteiniborus sp. MB09-C3]WIV13434.1 ABC transporter permease [Proteiniborus sp. MB09-C3]